jgi:hypothetical protein
MNHRPDQLNIQEVRCRLERAPSALRSLVAVLPAESMTYREAPGTWSPLEVLCHVADGEITDWMPRARLILSDASDKRFTPFDREGGFRRYKGWTSDAVLDELERLRRANVEELLALRITPSDLDRTGTHPEFGSVTLRQLFATWITHDFAHLAQISRIGVRFYGREIGPWTKYFSLLANVDSQSHATP